VHIGYLPANKVVGISKLARVVDGYARRPAGAGEAHLADRRLASPRCSSRAGVGCGRGCGAPVHDHTRGAQAQRVDDHQPHDRHLPQPTPRTRAEFLRFIDISGAKQL